MSDLWKSYKGHKAAYAEDPTKIDEFGHKWKQEFIDIGYCGWGPDTSFQYCEVCNATRGVLLHPGPNNKRYNGRFGMHEFERECNFDCVGKRLSKSQLETLYKQYETPKNRK